MLNRILILELAGVALAAAALACGRPHVALASSTSVAGRPAWRAGALPSASAPGPMPPAIAAGGTLLPLPPSRGCVVRMIVTAYCPCRKCCGRWASTPWSSRRTASGDSLAGLVAAGTRFAAADTTCHPFGTLLEVPGYGRAEVRDRGGAISGPDRLDVFFPAHIQALQWGRLTLDVTVIEETGR